MQTVWKGFLSAVIWVGEF